MSATDPRRWERVQEILADALELEADTREAFLDRACAGDVDLRAEVQSLLRASEEADHYFEDLADRVGMTAGAAGPRPAEAPDLEGRLVGAYRLGPLLGRGGMGAVYAAERADGHFDQQVALKILPLGAATPDAHRRFLEERRILARLEHPNIARLYDGGVTDDGTPFFVMERVAGLPLTEFCRKNGVDMDERLRLFLEICDTVSFAHQKLVVHRDLKPNNILVTDEGKVKLLDFGIARLTEPGNVEGTATALGGRLMTPRYAAPEQLKGEPVTTAADVYALGVILYELLTGISPYDLTGEITSLPEAVCSQTVTVPSVRLFRWAKGTVAATVEVRDVVATAEAMGCSVRALSRSLRGDLDNILLMALRKEPPRRYPSVEALAEDVRRFLDGFPVKARPESVAYVSGRFLRRNALPVMAAASVLLLLGVLLAMSVRFAVTSREQSLEIARERDRAAEIAHFMRELFEVANPALARGETVTARELLDRGVDRIREDHPDEPELQAEMMTVLGSVYRHLGLTSQALALLRDAAALGARLPDVREEDKAVTLLELGRVLRDVGDTDQAAETLRLARDRLALARGEEDREVAQATFDLGRTLHEAGRVVEAEREFRRAVAAFRTLELTRDTEYASTLFLMAEYAQVRGGQVEEAQAMYREALRILQAREGTDHPDIPRILAGLAWAHSRLGHPDSATVLLRQAADLARAVHGENGENGGNGENGAVVAEIYLNLGSHLARQGEPVEAEELLRRAEALFAAASQSQPDLHGAAILALADFLRDQGRTAAALHEYGRAASVLRSAYGPGSALEANVQRSWAAVLLTLERDAEAATLLVEAEATYAAILPATSPRLAEIREMLARARGGSAPR